MELICIKCPRGCNLKIDGNNVSGNLCPRGIAYAQEEMSNPMRMVTSLINVNGKIVPVKTSREVPKNMIDNVLNEIAKISVQSTQIGDVVLSNVCGLNVDVVVTGEAY